MNARNRRRTRAPRIETLEERRLLSLQATPSLDLGRLAIDADTSRVESVLVRYRPEAVTAAANGLVTLAGESLGLVSGLRKVSLAPGQGLTGAIEFFRGDSLVLYAQPDYRLHLLDSLAPNDPGYTNGQLWGMNNIGQSNGTADADIDAPEAWSINTGSGSMIVAVIDTGVNYNHPDLVQNIWTNAGEVPGNGIDDDGNGYVDDVHGYDFINNDGDPMDDHGHGTHVSGTIGAVGNNGVGVAGVNWDVQIMGLKFLGANGSGDSSDAIRALAYAVAMGARVSNNSYGGDGYDQAFADALSEAGDAGHIFVAAAGNDNRNIDSDPTYPGSYNLANVVSVAATDRNDNRASFSNYGVNTVELGAPGVSIYSTTRNGGYGTSSGTSMAAPHVAGAVALVWDEHPDWTYDEVIARILDTVDPVPSLAGKTVTGGRLNVRRAIDTYGPTPDIVDVSPDPRTEAVGSIAIVFNEPVDGLDLADLALTRDGGANLLTASQTLTTADGGRTYTLGNLAGLTGTSGSYTLTLTAAGSGIADDAGNAMTSDASESWVVSPASGALDFSSLSISSYGVGQDVAGTAAVEDGGATLHLTGNTWKKISLPYAVTAATVLEFDFRSPAQGEVHTIGFDTDDALSEDRGFRLYGTQAWGIAAHNTYAASAPGWVTYRIAVGQFYTGAMSYLFFGNDHDVASPTAQSYFRNVRVFEDAPPPSGMVDFTGRTISSYGVNQDTAGTAAVEDGGATLHLTGNTWKKISLPYAVTAATVLEFDFRSPAQGEVHTIGFDTDDALSEDRGFRLYGTQAWGIAAHNTYAASAPGWVTYRIAVGQFYTGAMSYLFFGNDHDVASPTAQSYFRNVRVFEDAPPPSGMVDFTGRTISSYGVNQDTAGTAAVEDAGATLHLTGNTWKKISLPYAVTAATVLEFDFRSPAQGEVHTIGFDTDDALSEDRGFRLYGTQAWGIAAHNTYAASAPGWVTYRIAVGQFYTGEMLHLFFGNDHDVASPTAQSYFRNVRVFQQTS